MQDLKSATKAGVTVSFSLLNFVVSLHAAVGDDDSLRTRTVCTGGHDPSPIKQKWVCPECESEDRASFSKAIEAGDGFVVIPPEVIEQDKAAAKEFDSIVLTTHPADQVTGVLLPSGKSYYLALKAPNKGTREAYSVLSRIVRERSDVAFMTKFALRSVVSIMQLTVAGDGTLVLTQMAPAELVRKHPVIEFADLSEQAVQMANELTDMLLCDFVESSQGTGKSQIIAEYAAMNTPVKAAEGPLPTQVVDISDRLAAIVTAAAAAKADAEAQRTQKVS